jgi:hypothetical protein
MESLNKKMQEARRFVSADDGIAHETPSGRLNRNVSKNHSPQQPVTTIICPMTNLIVEIMMVSLDGTKRASQSGGTAIVNKTAPCLTRFCCQA